MTLTSKCLRVRSASLALTPRAAMWPVVSKQPSDPMQAPCIWVVFPFGQCLFNELLKDYPNLRRCLLQHSKHVVDFLILFHCAVFVTGIGWRRG